MGHVFIVGCGETGRRIATVEMVGHRVFALVRRESAGAALARLGVAPTRIIDLDRPASIAASELAPAVGARLYYLAPPPPRGTSDPRLESFLDALPGAPGRIVYVSTTGVYGDRAGGWVDESTPPAPATDRARRRLAAEAALRGYGEPRNVPVIVLRAGAIYGPGRLPLERITAGSPVMCEDEAPITNRIHVDDLAVACVAAMDSGVAGAVYDVTDGHPTSSTHFVRRVAMAAGLPVPPERPRAEVERLLGPVARSFLGESRRVSGRKLRDELGVRLLYEDLDAGIAASLAVAGDRRPA